MNYHSLLYKFLSLPVKAFANPVKQIKWVPEGRPKGSRHRYISNRSRFLLNLCASCAPAQHDRQPSNPETAHRVISPENAKENAVSCL